MIFKPDCHAPRHNHANKKQFNQSYISKEIDRQDSLCNLAYLPELQAESSLQEKWIAPRRKYRNTMNVSLTETDIAPSHVAWLVLIAYI